MNGTLVNDTFKFNNSLEIQMEFLAVTNQTNFDSFPCDGLLGLSYFANTKLRGLMNTMKNNVMV